MAAVKVQLNIINVSFGGTTITRVTSFAPDPGAQFIEFFGDDDRYATVIANSENRPTATLTTADIGTIAGIAIGAVATLSATYQDANKQAGGNVVWTLANAVFTGYSPSQSHGSFGSVTAHFMLTSSDGQTTPISMSRA